MTGKDFFKKYDLLINIVIKIFSFFPKKFLVFLYDFIFSQNYKLSYFLRYCILKNLAKQVGKNIYIARNVVLKNIEKLEIGDNVSIHEFCYIDGAGGISIGNNVSISHNCSIISFDHKYNFNDDTPIKYQGSIFEKIIIGNNIWIGCNTKILKGTILEDNIVIAAGSVLRKKVYIENSLYVGEKRINKKMNGERNALYSINKL